MIPYHTITLWTILYFTISYNTICILISNRPHRTIPYYNIPYGPICLLISDSQNMTNMAGTTAPSGDTHYSLPRPNIKQLAQHVFLLLTKLKTKTNLQLLFQCENTSNIVHYNGNTHSNIEHNVKKKGCQLGCSARRQPFALIHQLIGCCHVHLFIAGKTVEIAQEKRQLSRIIGKPALMIHSFYIK